ncbi:MAG TPA: hypothetical protein VF735_08880 [Pyrinomonadaceae bacterium]|jgi:hypothetical protein
MDDKLNSSVATKTAGTGAATGTAMAQQPVAEADAGLYLKDWVNRKIINHKNPTIDFQGKEVTVLGIRNNGIRGRDETGADVLIPLEDQYLTELFKELVSDCPLHGA